MTTKKTHTAADVDLAAAESFIEGFAECYVLLTDTLRKLQQSVGDVQSIYYIGDVVGKKAQQVAELQTAFDTLTQLHDMMEADYFEKLDEHKAMAQKEEYEALRKDLGL